MSTFKRVICMVLSLVMVLGMFPVSAFATDAGLEVPVTEPVITEIVPETAPVMPEVIPAPVPEIIPEAPVVPVEPVVSTVGDGSLTPPVGIVIPDEPTVSQPAAPTQDVGISNKGTSETFDALDIPIPTISLEVVVPENSQTGNYVELSASHYEVTEGSGEIVSFSAKLNSADLSQLDNMPVVWLKNGVLVKEEITMGGGFSSASFGEGAFNVGTNIIKVQITTFDGTVVTKEVSIVKHEAVKTPVVTLDMSYASVEEGSTVDLLATVDGVADNTLVSWQSSNPNVATVYNGTVTGVAPGQATIIVADLTDGVEYARCIVTVNATTPGTVVTISPIVYELQKNQSINIRASVSGTGRFDCWHIDDASQGYYSIANDREPSTTLTALNITSSPVRLYAHADDGTSAYIEFSIVPADSLQLEANPGSIKNGETSTVYIVNAIDDEEFTWNITPSANDGVLADFRNLGSSVELTAGTAVGSITVSATSKIDQSRTASVTVYVNPGPIDGTFNGSPAWVDSKGNLLIVEENFPSANFRDVISKNFDSESNGYLTVEQVADIKVIECADLAINSLKGIEYFTALEGLNCSYNSLNELDISKNTVLTILSCTDNMISALDISKNTELTTLYCSYNTLSALDCSANTNLKVLDCSRNRLEALNLAKNTSLQILSCGSNFIPAMDLSTNTALIAFDCDAQGAFSSAYWDKGYLKMNLNNILDTQSLQRVSSVSEGSFDQSSGIINLGTPAAGVEMVSFIYYYDTNAGFENNKMPVIVMAEVPESPYFASGTCGTNVTWTLDEEGTLTISGTGEMYNYYSSPSVPWYGYQFSIKAVVIEDSVTSIGNYAFYNCINLRSVTISDSVTSIGDYAFDGCQRLDSVTIPDSVTSIGDYSFSSCKWLSSVTIPNGVTSIGNYAFSYCSMLSSVTIPNSVTSIGDYAFDGCSSSLEITFGGTVKEWCVCAVSGIKTICTDGTVTIVSAGSCGDNLNWMLDDVGTLTIYGTGEMGIGTWSDYKGDIKAVVIEPGVTNIRPIAFENCSSLTSVIIPDSVTSVGFSAFENCRSLTSVIIPNSVTSIGFSAFDGCNSGLEITFGGTVKEWRNFAITGIKTICTDGTVTIVSAGSRGENLDWMLDDAGTLTIYGTGEMGTGTWRGYEDDIKAVVIEPGVTSIGSFAFESCSSLTSVTIPDSVTSIGERAFANCSSLTSVTIPDSVTSIGGSAFRNCSSLTSVTIPDGVTVIGGYAFSECRSLSSVMIGNRVTSIDNGAFESCSSLTSVTIPDSVTSIGVFAFLNCYNLKSIEFQHGGNAALYIDANAFHSGGSDFISIKILVPDIREINPAISEYRWSDDRRNVIYECITHTEVLDEAVEPTCTETGLTEGKHCSVCDAVIKVQEITPTVPHTLELQEADYHICFGGYKEAYYECVFCSQAFADENASEPAEFIEGHGGHKKVKKSVPAVAATDTELGCKAYSLTQCETCGAKFKADGSIYTDAEWEDYLDTLIVYAKAKSVTLSNAEGIIDSGSTRAVDITETFQMQLYAEIAPVTAKEDVTWKSSSTTLATVDADGLVTFLKPGVVTITATAADGSGKSANVKFDVSYMGYAANVKFTGKLSDMSTGFGGKGYPTPTKNGLQEGDSVQLQLFGADKNTAISDLSAFEFSVAKGGDFVSVDDNGLVTALKAGGTGAVVAKLKGDPLKRSFNFTIKTIAQGINKVNILPANPDDVNFSYVAEIDAYMLSQTMEPKKGGSILSYQLRPQAFGSSGDELAELTGRFTWASSNSSIATVVEDKYGNVTLSIKPGVEGDCTITATAKDTIKAQGILYISVKDFAPRLEAAAATLDAQKGSSAILSISESYYNSINSVEFIGTGVDGDSIKAEFRYEDVYESSDGFTGRNEYVVLSATRFVKNQTIKGQLMVHTDLDDYPLPLNINIKNTVPAVTVKQTGKVNLFNTNSTAEISVTVKNETVENVVLESNDFAGTWVDGKLIVDCKTMSAKPNTKASLRITLAGYEYPVEKAVTIGTETKKPALAAETPSATINLAYGSESLYLRIKNNTEKNLLPVEGVSLTFSPDVVKYRAVDPYTFELYDISPDFMAKNGGKISISVMRDDWSSPIVLPYTVKVNTTNLTLKPKASSLSLNVTFPGIPATTEAVFNQANIQGSYIRDAELEPVKANTETGKLSVRFENGQFVAEILDDSVKPGSYAYSFIPVCDESGKTLAAVKLSVRVVNTQPKVTLSANTISLNAVHAGMETGSINLNCTTAGYKVVDGYVTATDTKQDVIDNAALLDVYCVEADDKIQVVAGIPGTAPKAGSYKFTVTPIVAVDNEPDEIAELKPINLTVKVYSNGKYSVAVSASGKLDAVARDTCAITYTVTKLTNVSGNVVGVDISGQDAEMFEVFMGAPNAKGQATAVLKLKSDESYSTSKSYKLQLDFLLDNGITVSSSVLTVKVSSSAIKLVGSPKVVNVYQSQSRARIVYYDLRVTSPVGAKIDSVQLGKLNAAQQAFKDVCSVYTDVADDGTSARVKLVIRDVGALGVNKTYTLPLEIWAEGQLTTTPAKLSMSVKVMK